MGKIDEKIKGKRCSFNLRISPDLRDAFRDKCTSLNINSSDLVRSWMEHFAWGHKKDNSEDIDDVPSENITLRIGVDRRKEFAKICDDMSLNMSAVTRTLIDGWLKENGYEVDKK